MIPVLRSEETARRVWIAWALMAGVGAAAAALVSLGNPGNMGVCGACFLRDLAGALGAFAGEGPRIFRPELAGLILGAFAWAAVSGRFEARSGSHAAARFFLGVLMGWGALVFLGCPFRMLQRIGGGDLNALVGAIGFVGGVGVGLIFEKHGYSVGRTSGVPTAVGSIGPAVGAGLLVAFLTRAGLAGPGPGESAGPAHAFWTWSLAIGLLVGAVLSATGFCAVSAARQVFQKKRVMLAAAGFLILGYVAAALATGKWNGGWGGQPIAHGETVWNVAALALVGLTGVLAGGCPVRQLVMAGEGNGDAFVGVMGLVLGGATAHGLGIASSGTGTTPAGRTVVVIGLIAAVGYAFAATFLRKGRGPESVA